MGRKEYMQCRRRCKKMSKGQMQLSREVDEASRRAQTGDENANMHLLEVLDLSQKAATMMQLLQLDAWEARQACISRGVRLPAPHRSEGRGFHGETTECLAELRARLEAGNDADVEALIAQGRA